MKYYFIKKIKTWKKFRVVTAPVLKCRVVSRPPCPRLAARLPVMSVTQNRPLLHSMIHTGSRTAETNRIAEAQKKRAARKARLYTTTCTSAGPTYPCPECGEQCGRVLQARIGLISHLRTHKVNQTWQHHHRRRYGHHRIRWTKNRSAVCSGSPHSHAELSASPYFFMYALYRTTPVRSLFRVVQCFRFRSSPLTPSPGSDTWRCTQMVLGWVRMLPTPASTLPQYIHPSTGPHGWHLASPEPPCCRVYGTLVCMEALHCLSCRAGCASRV